MYRGAETSSSFYRSMRDAFAGDAKHNNHQQGGDTSAPLPVQQQYNNGRTATMSDIQHRLNAIGRLSSSNSTVAASSVPHSAQQQRFATPLVAYQDSRSATLAEASAALGNYDRSSSSHIAAPPAAIPPPPVGVDDDETLTPTELRALRMIEIAAPVRVLLGELHHPPKPMQLLADEANVRIFPRHVFISRPHNGAPIAEIVIMELSELTEDEQRGTLSFCIRKP
ncbi:Hypothetical protein, putative, partial [Bodo saltans]